MFCITASANPVRNELYDIQQPNGDIIDCFRSGDEYFNYIHDVDGYLMLTEGLFSINECISSFLLAIIFDLYYNTRDT